MIATVLLLPEGIVAKIPGRKATSDASPVRLSEQFAEKRGGILLPYAVVLNSKPAGFNVIRAPLLPGNARRIERRCQPSPGAAVSYSKTGQLRYDHPWVIP